MPSMTAFASETETMEMIEKQSLVQTANVYVPDDLDRTNNKKPKAQTKVLSTYGGSGNAVKNHFLHVALSASMLTLAVFLCLGLVYIPAMNPMKDYSLSSADECFASANSTCENYLKAKVYFWNLTNPNEFLSGLEAPKLQEVGPYAMTDGRAKNQNVTFSGDLSEVEFVQTLYAKVDAEGTCVACSLEADEIISINPAYIEIIKEVGSEANLALQALPQTLSGLLSAMVGFIMACAYDPSLSPYFPSLTAALNSGFVTAEDLAYGQILSYSPTFGAGVPITELPGLSAAVFAPMYEAFGIDTSLTAPLPSFEVHGYHKALLISLGYPTPPAYTSSSALALKYFFQNITSDATGTTVLRYLQTPDAMITAELGFADDNETQLMKGWLAYVAQSFGLPALQKFTIGEFLSTSSSGLIIKRTAKDWIFGYEDPLLNTITGSVNKINAIHAIRDIDTMDQDHVPWGADAKTMLRAGATKYSLKTGLGVSKGSATQFLTRTDGDLSESIVYYVSNHTEIVYGKEITGGQYEEIKEQFKRKGEEAFVPTVEAWADFGQGLDLRRKVTLKHVEGATRTKNAKVSTEVYSLSPETFLNCPISECEMNQNFFGAFNFSGFQGIDGFYSLAHGFQTDFRAFGGEKSSYPYTSFTPKQSSHDAEFEIYARTGNTVGMKVPLQTNFKVKPTDAFYASIWQPSTTLSPIEAEVGLHIPICYLELSYEMPESFFNGIADTINHITMMTIVYLFVMPAISVLFIFYASVTLYVRHKLARNPMSEQDIKKRANSSNSKAIGSFHDASFILGKSFNKSLLEGTDTAPKSFFKRSNETSSSRRSDDHDLDQEMIDQRQIVHDAAPFEHVSLIIDRDDSEVCPVPSIARRS